jgi:hypothetical protein
MKQLTIIIDWYGPYRLDEAILAAKNDFQGGLYMAMGKSSLTATRKSPQYIGLSSKLANRLKGHIVLSSISDASIWLGEVVTAEPPGKKFKKTTTSLDYAEWFHAYLLKLPKNNKKRKSPPSRPATLLNRWWKKDYDTPWSHRPHPSWPDFFDYPYNNYPIKIVWFGKYQKRIHPPYLV